MLQIHIHKNLCVIIRIYCLINIQINCIFWIFKKLCGKSIFSIFNTTQNKLFTLRLLHSSSSPVLQTSKLASRITSERMDSTLRKKHISIINERLTDICYIKILPRLKTKNFDCIRIAIGEKINNLFKRINSCISFLVNHLLKSFTSQNVLSIMSSYTTNINITVFIVSTIGITTTKS